MIKEHEGKEGLMCSAGCGEQGRCAQYEDRCECAENMAFVGPRCQQHKEPRCLGKCGGEAGAYSRPLSSST